MLCHQGAARVRPALPRLQVSTATSRFLNPGPNAPVSLRGVAELQSEMGHFDVALKTPFPSLCRPLFLSVPMLTSPLRSDPAESVTKTASEVVAKLEPPPAKRPLSISQPLCMSTYRRATPQTSPNRRSCIICILFRSEGGQLKSLTVAQ